MLRTFISWITAFEKDPFSAHGKLASLWFDELVLEVPRKDGLESVIEHVARENDLASDVVEEMRKIIRPVQSVLPDYKMTDATWEHEDKKLVEAVEQAMRDHVQRTEPNADPRDALHEIAVGGVGILHSLVTWTAINSMEPCNIISNEVESKVIQMTFSKQKLDEEFPQFSEVVESRIPNLDELSWNRIIELRHHQFMDEFRSKLYEVNQALSEQEGSTAADLINEFELRDLREFAKICEPAPLKTAIKAISSNAPLGIPLNPVSIGIGIKEVADAFENKKRFGWLYFLLDLDS